MPTQEELRKNRSNKRSQLTKKVNELRRLVAEDRRSEVLLKYDLIKGNFSEFDDAHSEYHETLETETDIIASDKYFEDMESNCINGLNSVREYIKNDDNPSSVHVKPVTSTQTDSQAVSFVKLPPAPHPDVFSGKSESYPMWMASFKSLVGKHNIGYDEKMYYLKQYTSGEAQGAIEALFLCPNKESYESALEILEDRFGQPSLVASAFRKKLESWSKVGDRDGKALQKFADYLNQICIAKRSYKCLDILSDEFENKKILRKLPAWLVKKWIEVVVKADDFPNFDEFSKFISANAKIANHALWDGHTSTHSSSVKSQSALTSQSGVVPHRSHALQTGAAGVQKEAVNSLNTNGNQAINARVKSCPVCEGDHTTVKCPVFANMSLTDRKATIRNKGMCFGCLFPGHHSKDCRTRHTCAVCSKKHPTLLHDYGRQQSLQMTSLFLDNKCNGRATTMVVHVLLRHSSSDKEVIVYALLDTQSNTNFVTTEVVKMLNVTGTCTTLDLTTMNGRTRMPSQRIDGLEVKGVSGDEYIDIASCFTRLTIPCSHDSIPTTEILEKWPHLSEIQLPPYYENAPIGLLIGYHCPQAMGPLEIVAGGADEPFGWRTSLGWCVVGVTRHTDVVNDLNEIGSTHIVHGCIALRTDCREVMLDETDVDVSSVGYGMKHMDDKYSAEDVNFMQIMSTQMFQRSDKHYEAPLPLKCEDDFPLNKSVAQRRLSGLKSKFEKDSEYHKRYTAVMNEMIENGFAEVVPADEVASEGRTWYIPHHGVQQGKLRVVFDCSSKFLGVSINDRLLQGPNLMNLLLGILWRFRLESVALTCDIQKMYHQFMVSPKDKDLLRFLWWENGDLSSDPVDHRMRVHLFGATSSPGVATYGLRKIASDHAERHAVEASQFVHNDFYVDDGVTSVGSVSSACTLFKETQSLLAEGALKCHKVMSNSNEVLEGVPEGDRATLSDSKLHKTLGVMWNVETDMLHFPLELDSGLLTRRSLLSNLSKIFDPLGVIAPLLHQGKMLLHEMCKDRYDWDQVVSGDLLKKCERWCDSMGGIGEVVIPRHICSGESMHSVELHHFADACSTGYAACSYLRFVDEQGVCHVSFLYGKCRVVPMKPVLNIPRLELMAAVLSVQLATKLRKELPLQFTEYFWSDSMVVLRYIKNTAARFHVFVANRVQRIHDGSRPGDWFHVNSSDNPADDGSRGVWSQRWLQGPEFLYNPEFVAHQSSSSVSVDDVEVKCLSCQSEEMTVEEDSHVRTFRNWFSTLKVWAWVLRFIHKCRGGKKSGDLRVESLRKLSVVCWRWSRSLPLLMICKSCPRRKSCVRAVVCLSWMFSWIRMVWSELEAVSNSRLCLRTWSIPLCCHLPMRYLPWSSSIFIKRFTTKVVAWLVLRSEVMDIGCLDCKSLSRSLFILVWLVPDCVVNLVNRKWQTCQWIGSPQVHHLCSVDVICLVTFSSSLAVISSRGMEWSLLVWWAEQCIWRLCTPWQVIALLMLSGGLLPFEVLSESWDVIRGLISLVQRTICWKWVAMLFTIPQLQVTEVVCGNVWLVWPVVLLRVFCMSMVHVWLMKSWWLCCLRCRLW